MKRVVPLTISLLLLIAGVPRPVEAAPLNVEFVGDSLTAGLYAASDAASYPVQLANYWQVPIAGRVGTSGATTAGLLNGVAQLPMGAGLVVLEVGTNDFGVTDQNAFWAAYGNLIAAVKARQPGRYLCLGLWRDLSDASPLGTRLQYDQEIYALCSGHFVDLSGLYADQNYVNHGPAGRATWQGPGDWFHPNDRGHSWIAATIAGQYAGGV